jgi:aryl-alcohol dehydrogenase-like predicted oxidoreductase
VELALGTVQWGSAYGIAGRGSAVPEDEVRAVLEQAWQRGVRVLDTAAAYGDIEERLARLIEGLPYRVVSKISTLPATLDDREAAAWAVGQARRSRQRLGPALGSLLFHRAEDLVGVRGTTVWRELSAWAREEGVALGASVYDPQKALDLAAEFGIAVTQLPGNVFDQRLARTMPVPPVGLEVHLRSALLQGLLLMDTSAAVARLPIASQALRAWHDWCVSHDLSPLVAALSIVKGFAATSTVVVGVDSLTQFAEIADAWGAARPVEAPALAQHDLSLIDPRLWNVSP